MTSGLIETEPTDVAAPPVVPRLRGWLAPLFFLAGLGLLPWTAYLIATLPSRHLQTGYYDLAWGGFDVALAALLAATGVGLLRRRLWVQSTATAAATMLVCDAWFDVLSSQPGAERLMAVVLALLVELPSALVCLLVARHVEEVAERGPALRARRTPFAPEAPSRSSTGGRIAGRNRLSPANRAVRRVATTPRGGRSVRIRS